MFELTSKLFNTLGFIIALAFFFTKFKSAKNIFTKEKQNKKDIILLSIFFSGLAILGTFIGVDYKGAIVNTRNIGVIVGGILSGPEVALISAIIAGVHRLFINFDSVTAVPCAISTIFGGFLAGYLYKKTNNKNRYIFGFIAGVVVESLSMLLILILTPDKVLAQDIVKTLYLPMILINAIGVSIVIIITEGILEEKEKEAGTQAKLALEIANKTLPFFRKGASLDSVCKILLDSLEAQVVVITDKENIIASSASKEEFDIKHQHIKSSATREVLDTGTLLVFNSDGDKSDFPFNKTNIKSCIIAPLFQDDKITGTLKIYFDNDEHITARKEYLAIGLSQVISTQIEISRVEHLKAMARDAELKALQNQINPHFLFNALNTTASFVRFDPSKARDIIIDLSTYLRFNLENSDREVSLEKELEQVRAYINIEKARFSNRFSIKYDIDENISDIKIPSLTIQPLVENSIKHGILKQREMGTVTISIRKRKHSCLISIEDNGVGIDQEIIDTIDQEIDRSIGLKNVHNRLKLMYGKGLQIKKLKQGTKISFEI